MSKLVCIFILSVKESLIWLACPELFMSNIMLVWHLYMPVLNEPFMVTQSITINGIRKIRFNMDL